MKTPLQLANKKLIRALSTMSQDNNPNRNQAKAAGVAMVALLTIRDTVKRPQLAIKRLHLMFNHKGALVIRYPNVAEGMTQKRHRKILGR